ncbi:MAG: hypothetical protein ACYC4D_06585 [Thermoleophilia bacterium]
MYLARFLLFNNPWKQALLNKNPGLSQILKSLNGIRWNVNSISRKKCRHKNIHKILLLIFLSLPALLLAQLASGCGNGGNTAGSGSSKETVLDPLPLTTDSLQQIVISSLVDKSDMRNADLTGEGAEKVVNIGIDRPAGLEDGSVEANMALITQKIMPVLFEFPEISRVTITMYGVKQGIKSDDVAVKVGVNKVSVQDIDWSMLGPMTLSWYVPEYYIDPMISGTSGFGGDGTGAINN